MTQKFASAQGIATVHGESVLSVWYPSPIVSEDRDYAEQRAESDDAARELAALEGSDEARGTVAKVVSVTIDLEAAPASAEDAYLRLHVLSHRLVQPNTINLDGLFGRLTNVVWTSQGACAVPGFELTRARLSARRHLAVYGVDKFPRMTDFVVPGDVRIGDADRVRLGAHLAPGTVVMHEGFVNFNAGTLGSAMIEGRISQGVVIGDGSDIGGGASTMGTLSGGNNHRISVGTGTLLGANSGIGISIGDDCVVEAGLYLTSGSLVTLVDDGGRIVKARELDGADNVLFRRNSKTGAIEALARSDKGIALNPDLH